MHFHYPELTKPCRLSTAAIGFLSFDQGQGYLQLAMEESDIKKTAFRASSMGLYEFTHMPFRLSNAGFSFCCLMEQCLGDQQFVTLLLYLDDICIFAPTIDEMLDKIQLVFDRLKNAILKSSLRNVISLALVFFEVKLYSLEQYIGLIEDKLSSTTVDFFRSEGYLEIKCLYWIREPKKC